MKKRHLTPAAILSILLALVTTTAVVVLAVNNLPLSNSDLAVADDCTSPGASCDSHGCRLDKGESWCESTQQCHPAGKDCPTGGGGGQNPPPPTNPTCVPNKKAGDACLPSCGDNACDGKQGPLECVVCPSTTNAAGASRCMNRSTTAGVISACGGNKQTTSPATPSTPTNPTSPARTCGAGSHPGCVGKQQDYIYANTCACKFPVNGSDACVCQGLGDRDSFAACSSNTDCLSKNCENKLCHPAKYSVGITGRCISDIDCTSGLLCKGEQCTSSGTKPDNVPTPSLPTSWSKFIQRIADGVSNILSSLGQKITKEKISKAEEVLSKFDVDRGGGGGIGCKFPCRDGRWILQDGSVCYNALVESPQCKKCENGAVKTLSDTTSCEELPTELQEVHVCSLNSEIDLCRGKLFNEEVLVEGGVGYVCVPINSFAECVLGDSLGRLQGENTRNIPDEERHDIGSYCSPGTLSICKSNLQCVRNICSDHENNLEAPHECDESSVTECREMSFGTVIYSKDHCGICLPVSGKTCSINQERREEGQCISNQDLLRAIVGDGLFTQGLQFIPAGEPCVPAPYDLCADTFTCDSASWTCVKQVITDQPNTSR